MSFPSCHYLCYFSGLLSGGLNAFLTGVSGTIYRLSKTTKGSGPREKMPMPWKQSLDLMFCFYFAFVDGVGSGIELGSHDESVGSVFHL